jgi:N-methylhydantoinase A
MPGPACYAKGGTHATVTDANVVLGYLNPHGLAGGTVPIDCELACAAIQKIADRLGLGLMEGAYGIHRLANAAMTRAVKAVSTYRGRDPRDFSLFAFGGNGGVHASSLAHDLQIRQVLVPPAAGVFSAVGLLCADREALRSAAFLRPLETVNVTQALERCAALEQQARADVGASEDTVVRWRAALRYAGQGFELAIELPQNVASHTDPVQDIRAAFEREYRRTYGHELQGHRLEFVALRVLAAVPPSGAHTVTRLRSAPHRAPRDTSRMAYFGAPHGLLDTPVIGREALDVTPRPGPLIIEEYEGTTVVPPQATALRDPFGNIVVALAGGHLHAA